ncbi:MAG: DUF3800 domain-containing protein, partial [Syntrophobacterales bacterium]|nr:DUF3800 domain-containing protein [Syntrophobacterales bacterium]
RRRLWPFKGATAIWRQKMYVCYVDESGDSGTLQISDTNANPFFIITGLIVEHTRLISITHEFLRIKARFFLKSFYVDSYDA